MILIIYWLKVKRDIILLPLKEMFFLSSLFERYLFGKACYEKCRKLKYDRSSADIRIGDLWGRMYKHNEKMVSAAVADTKRVGVIA